MSERLRPALAIRFVRSAVRQVAPTSLRGCHRPVLVRGTDRHRHHPPVEGPWRA